jgi:hypothetical protein
MTDHLYEFDCSYHGMAYGHHKKRQIRVIDSGRPPSERSGPGIGYKIWHYRFYLPWGLCSPLPGLKSQMSSTSLLHYILPPFFIAPLCLVLFSVQLSFSCFRIWICHKSLCLSAFLTNGPWSVGANAEGAAGLSSSTGCATVTLVSPTTSARSVLITLFIYLIFFLKFFISFSYHYSPTHTRRIINSCSIICTKFAHLHRRIHL